MQRICRLRSLSTTPSYSIERSSGRPHARPSAAIPATALLMCGRQSGRASTPISPPDPKLVSPLLFSFRFTAAHPEFFNLNKCGERPTDIAYTDAIDPSPQDFPRQRGGMAAPRTLAADGLPVIGFVNLASPRAECRSAAGPSTGRRDQLAAMCGATALRAELERTSWFARVRTRRIRIAC
jgi:hypothetical protein